MSVLYLLSLPIGNSEDITLRAVRHLKEKNTFLAEDTRVFKDLLRSLEIDFSTKFIDSFHDNSESKLSKIIEKIKNGQEIVLVSDAGSPIISDPAYPLVKAAIKEEISIVTIPGPTSVIAALELSGLPATPFYFWGFLGRDLKDKKFIKQKIDFNSGTHILFESPQRIKETLNFFINEMNECEIVVVKEITKTFQTVYRINDTSDIEEIDSRGEFVLLIYKKNTSHSAIDDDLKNLVLDYLNSKSTTKQLAKIFSKITDEDTKDIYKKLTKE